VWPSMTPKPNGPLFHGAEETNPAGPLTDQQVPGSADRERVLMRDGMTNVGPEAGAAISKWHIIGNINKY